MRSDRLALVGLAGGGLLTVAVITVMHQQRNLPAQQTPQMSVPAENRSADLVRCRQATKQDPTCEAAWEAERRRFFGADDRNASSVLQERGGHE